MACSGIVFGGSKGLGYHSARALASMGCSILLFARTPEGLSQASRALRYEYHVEIETFRGDLRNKEDIVSALEKAYSQFDGLDHAIIAYGNISREPIGIDEAFWEDWIEASELYLASTAQILNHLYLYNSKPSTTVILNSFTVPEPMDLLVIPDTVRAGLSRLVRVASRKYAPKVRPLMILLGSFRTPGALRTVSEIAKRYSLSPGEFWRSEVEALSPLKRSGSLLEFERFMIRVLTAPEYLVGGVLVFDGGSSRVAWP